MSATAHVSIQADPAILTMLQARLSDSLDISSRLKEAGWNAKDTINYSAYNSVLHGLEHRFDVYADELAKRLDAAGGQAPGGIHTSATTRTLYEYPHAAIASATHVNAIMIAMAAFGRKVRENSDEAQHRGDTQTFELFYDIARGVDTTLWELQSYTHH